MMNGEFTKNRVKHILKNIVIVLLIVIDLMFWLYAYFVKEKEELTGDQLTECKKEVDFLHFTIDRDILEDAYDNRGELMKQMEASKAAAQKTLEL